MERHLSLVQYDRLGLGLNRAQEREVFHYTNISGLRGILESRSLWASEYRFLNDSSEIRFGLQIIEMLIASRHGIAEQFTPELREEVLMALALLIEGQMNFYVFSTSFCRRGNLLSQWRAYGGRDGLAIAFRKSFLQERAAAGGFATERVHYYFAPTDPNTVSLTDWLNGKADTLNASLENLPASVRAELSSDEEDLLETLVRGHRSRLIDRWLLETAAFIKHPAFSEEAEWRCVAVVDNSIQHSFELCDRPSGTRIVPYVNFQLGTREDRDIGISHIILGPNADYDALQHAVSHLTTSRNIALGGIIAPNIPFRI